jgi:hypothetical protein
MRSGDGSTRYVTANLRGEVTNAERVPLVALCTEKRPMKQQ